MLVEDGAAMLAAGRFSSHRRRVVSGSLAIHMQQTLGRPPKCLPVDETSPLTKLGAKQESRSTGA